MERMEEHKNVTARKIYGKHMTENLNEQKTTQRSRSEGRTGMLILGTNRKGTTVWVNKV
jgi:hypothetical protein